MVVLKGADGETVLAQRADALETGFGGGDGGHDRNPLGKGASADLDLLTAGDGSGGSVNHQRDFAVFHEVDHIGSSLGKLEQGGDGDAGIGQLTGGAFAGNNPEAQIVQSFAQTDGGGLIAIPHA